MTTPVVADNALHTHTGGTDARAARLAQAALIAVQGPTILDARTGVMVGPGSRALLSGTSSTGPMTVAYAAFQWVTSRGAANGPYLGKHAAAGTVTIAAAPGSGQRTDVVYVKQQDSTPGVPTPDATTAPIVAVVTGTVGQGKPAIPVGAEELGTVVVKAGATRTDNATLVTIANTARQTTTRGAPIPVADETELGQLAAYPTAQALTLNNGRRRWHDGTRWRYDGDHVLVANVTERDQLAAYAGLRALDLATGIEWRHDGSAWWPFAGNPLQGKVWRDTFGSTNYPAANLSIAVVFTKSRLGSGFLLDSGAALLTVPLDGFYDLRMRGYDTGGSGIFIWTTQRRRTGVADAPVLGYTSQKAAAGDQQSGQSDVGVPLKAGDQLYLSIGTVTISGTVTYYGSSEGVGTMLSARWVAPLNGTTPL